MTRREAIEYDNALKDAMKQVSLQYGMGESIGSYIVDNFITVWPEDARKGMIFLGEDSVSYKAGNVKIDLKKALIAGLELAASVNQPESILNYIQLIIVCVFFIEKSVRQDIGKLEARIVYFLHEKGAYDTGVEEERVICEMQECYQQKEGKALEREKIVDATNFLCEVKAIDLFEGKIYLNEKVFFLLFK